MLFLAFQTQLSIITSKNFELPKIISYSKSDEHFRDFENEIDDKIKNKVEKNEETESFKENSKAKNNCLQEEHYFYTYNDSYSILFQDELSCKDREMQITKQLSKK